MKHSIYAIAVLILVAFAGCKKGEDSKGCGSLSAFSVTQSGEQLEFSLNSGTAAMYYEVSYSQASSSPDPENGWRVIVNGTHEQKTIKSLSVGTGATYVFYARSICSDGNGPWSAPVSLSISDYCNAPTDLRISVIPGGRLLGWDANTDESHFQVQYGLSGFALGTGTTADVYNRRSYEGMSMMANRTYDFYVRAACPAGGWSSWAGPYTYESLSNQNTCTQPSALTWTIVRNGSGQAVGANFNWSRNGEKNFECVVVSRNQPASSGNIVTVDAVSTPTFTLTQSTDYDFFVRAVCEDGNKTAWSGPLQFNIGT